MKIPSKSDRPVRPGHESLLYPPLPDTFYHFLLLSPTCAAILVPIHALSRGIRLKSENIFGRPARVPVPNLLERTIPGGSARFLPRPLVARLTPRPELYCNG